MRRGKPSSTRNQGVRRWPEQITSASHGGEPGLMRLARERDAVLPTCGIARGAHVGPRAARQADGIATPVRSAPMVPRALPSRDRGLAVWKFTSATAPTIS